MSLAQVPCFDATGGCLGCGIASDEAATDLTQHEDAHSYGV